MYAFMTYHVSNHGLMLPREAKRVGFRIINGFDRNEYENWCYKIVG